MSALGREGIPRAKAKPAQIQANAHIERAGIAQNPMKPCADFARLAANYVEIVSFTHSIFLPIFLGSGIWMTV
jgi:hypothetical protein